MVTNSRQKFEKAIEDVLPDLAPGNRRRLAQDVHERARTIYGKASPPRPTTLRDELKRFAKHAESLCASGEHLSDTAWLHILALADTSQTPEAEDAAEHRAYLTRLARAVEQAAQLAKDDVRSTLDYLGGRSSDPRLRSFIRALAEFYRQYSGEEPTHTINYETDSPDSAFDQMCQEAVRVFVPFDGPFPTSAISSAIREVLAADRTTEQFTPPRRVFDSENNS